MSSIPIPGAPEDATRALVARFDALRQAYASERNPGARVRADRLARVADALSRARPKLAEAVLADFGQRSADETALLEIFPAIEALKHARRHVRDWMSTRRRPTSFWFLPGGSSVVPQPLGVVGIVVPWNYPIFLAVAPLAGALAAGNRVMLKLSEVTPRTAMCLADVLTTALGPDEIEVVTGDAAVARAFVSLPFDHLLFTGSTRVGIEVMRTAANHLVPVTLELGGKSPAIVGPGYPVAHAAERIAFGKCLNAGQTCIAPDYCLVPRPDVDAFVHALGAATRRLYPSIAGSPDYTSIVDDRQFDRLVAWLEEARASGARIVALSDAQAPARAGRRFPPFAVIGAPQETRLTQEEIFGPILPIIPYDTLDAAIGWINERPRPLALYVFDRDATRVDRVIDETVAGGVTVNDTILHVAQEELPFGGVGASGMGHYHGEAGFRTFSREKPVFRQSRLSAVRLLNPPYGARFRAMLRLLLR
jgi:acyl-CoA reductase-like NAD-dependent aldehyde dehydrogenase